MSSRRLSVVVLSLLLTLGFALRASAQTSATGALSGSVTDPSGAVIPNVTVTVTSADTAQSRTVATGSDGSSTKPAARLINWGFSRAIFMK